ncbi:MAG: phosphoribosyltransferase family protein [Balneolaceae bacterium]
MILLDKGQLTRIIKRMAYQVVEEARGKPICMIGLNERGFAVVSVMKEYVSEALGSEFTVHQLWAEDDSTFNFDDKIEENTVLVMVDDVIFSGLTMFKALNKIPELTSFNNVCVAAVVDRGHRKLPVQAGIVGLKVPTKLNEHVDFQLSENQPHKVILLKK